MLIHMETEVLNNTFVQGYMFSIFTEYGLYVFLLQFMCINLILLPNAAICIFKYSLRIHPPTIKACFFL